MNNLQSLLCEPHLPVLLAPTLEQAHVLCLNNQSLPYPASHHSRATDCLTVRSPRGHPSPPPNKGLPSSSLWPFPWSEWSHYHLPSLSYPTLLLMLLSAWRSSHTKLLPHGTMVLRKAGLLQGRVTCQGLGQLLSLRWTFRAILCNSGCWEQHSWRTRY